MSWATPSAFLERLLPATLRHIKACDYNKLHGNELWPFNQQLGGCDIHEGTNYGHINPSGMAEANVEKLQVTLRKKLVAHEFFKKSFSVFLSPRASFLLYSILFSPFVSHCNCTTPSESHLGAWDMLIICKLLWSHWELEMLRRCLHQALRVFCSFLTFSNDVYHPSWGLPKCSVPFPWQPLFYYCLSVFQGNSFHSCPKLRFEALNLGCDQKRHLLLKSRSWNG